MKPVFRVLGILMILRLGKNVVNNDFFADFSIFLFGSLEILYDYVT
jgi:hypothetical protein